MAHDGSQMVDSRFKTSANSPNPEMCVCVCLCMCPRWILSRRWCRCQLTLNLTKDRRCWKHPTVDDWFGSVRINPSHLSCCDYCDWFSCYFPANQTWKCLRNGDLNIFKSWTHPSKPRRSLRLAGVFRYAQTQPLIVFMSGGWIDAIVHSTLVVVSMLLQSWQASGKPRTFSGLL